MEFTVFLTFIILLRIAELILSKSNESWLLKNGAIEYGKNHYPYMVALHTMFFVALIIEYYFLNTIVHHNFLIAIYLILIALKIWVITSLGKYWNTKIYHINTIAPLKVGMYKYIKHPNYIIVIAEIAIIPLAFNLYYTAIIFLF